jgi:hypothetical protein
MDVKTAQKLSNYLGNEGAVMIRKLKNLPTSRANESFNISYLSGEFNDAALYENLESDVFEKIYRNPAPLCEYIVLQSNKFTYGSHLFWVFDRRCKTVHQVMYKLEGAK